MGKRISQLAEITTVDGDDLLNVVDVSDTTYSASGTNKRVTKANLLKEYDIFSGWIPAGETWTYASATTFTISGDKTSKYQKGDKIKLTQTSAKYFRITDISYSTPNTTITIDGMNLYTLANATITNPYYSKMENPQGFPQREVVLHTSTGTNSTITLSETSANFAYMDILYKTSNGSFDSMRIFNPNGFSANLISGNYYSSAVYIQNCVVSISGTSITFGSNAQVGLSSAGVAVATGSYISIVKIIGYRW